MYTIVTREELKNRINQEFNIKFHSIDDLMLLDTKWSSIDIHNTSDQEMLTKLGQLASFKGILYIVTEVSYMQSNGNDRGGVFKVNSQQLDDFCQAYAIKYNEPMFNQEAFIISFELKQCWVLHHENIYGLVKYK